jgi:DNA-binding XRE family transcriptional regulator
MGRHDNPVEKKQTQGAQLRMLRQEAKITLTAMAERLGYSMPYLSSVENGSRPVAPSLTKAYEQALGRPSGIAEQGRAASFAVSGERHQHSICGVLLSGDDLTLFRWCICGMTYYTTRQSPCGPFGTWKKIEEDEL